jgi:OOP family OmpA-OmpF porin
MGSMLRKILIAAAALLVAPSVSRAGMYVGGAFGQATTEHNVTDVNFDESALGWKLHAGYRFFRFFGAEASYIDFGEPEGTINGVTWKANSHGAGAFAVGALPIGKHFELFAKAGVLYVNTESTVAGIFESVSDTSTAYGGGLMVIFIGHLGVRLEAEKFEVSDTDNLWMYSLGLDFRF